MSQTGLKEDCYQIDNIYMVPAVHGSLEFADVVRRIFYTINPDCVAVEIPSIFTSHLLSGIKRLPYTSVIGYKDETENSFKIIPIIPNDSIIEASRLADENGADLFCVDIELHGIVNFNHLIADTYYANKIGLKNYCNEHLKYLPPISTEPTEQVRELYMAYQVSQLAKSFKKVLFVYGLYHHKHLTYILERRENLKKPDIEQVEQESAKLYHYVNNDLLGLYPYITYLYELHRKGLSHYHAGIELPPTDTHDRYIPIITDEFLTKAYEVSERLKSLPTSDKEFDAYNGLHELIIHARKLYKREWNDNAPMGKLAIASRFARNYGFVEGSLVPSPYNMVVASKSTINDDFAWEMHRLINFYPFFENLDGLPDIDIQDNIAFVNGNEEQVNLRFPYPELSRRKIPLKPRAKEESPGLWQTVWNMGWSLVSYPPEDVIIENYFQYLRRRGKQRLEESAVRTVEFQSSLLDGLDVKETMRGLISDKIYVKEQLPIRGEVGTVIIIFDEDDSFEKYPFQMTWYSEHPGESDLVLYSTMPGDKLVGPGIARAEYGGLLSVFPPKFMPDVWRDKRFDDAKNRTQRLQLAGIQYTDKKYILLISPNPPSSRISFKAEHYGKKFLYIPIKDIQGEKLRKIRAFHLLRDKSLRRIASRYINL